jgi:hypothetical protein
MWRASVSKMIAKRLHEGLHVIVGRTESRPTREELCGAAQLASR